MEQGVIILNEAERNLILGIRRQHIDFGRITCIIYIKSGKLDNAEFEKVVESVKLTK